MSRHTIRKYYAVRASIIDSAENVLIYATYDVNSLIIKHAISKLLHIIIHCYKSIIRVCKHARTKLKANAPIKILMSRCIQYNARVK